MGEVGKIHPAVRALWSRWGALGVKPRLTIVSYNALFNKYLRLGRKANISETAIAEAFDTIDPSLEADEVDGDMFQKIPALRSELEEELRLRSPKALAEEEAKRAVEAIEDEARRLGLAVVPEEELAELYELRLSKTLMEMNIEAERRKLEEERKALHITEEEFRKRSSELAERELETRKWSEALARLQFQFPRLAKPEAKARVEEVRGVKPFSAICPTHTEPLDPETKIFDPETRRLYDIPEKIGKFWRCPYGEIYEQTDPRLELRKEPATLILRRMREAGLIPVVKAPPPPPIIPPVEVRVTIPLVERRPRIEVLKCWECGRTFTTDLDLNERLSITRIAQYGTRTRIDAPILDWGRRTREFFNLCEACQQRKFSYTRDSAVAFLLVERKLSEPDLYAIGLTREDVDRFKRAAWEVWGIKLS